MCRTGLLRGLFRLLICLSLPSVIFIAGCDEFEDDGDSPDASVLRDEPDVTPAEPHRADPEPTLVSCHNGRRDGAETDIDCGGPECVPCEAGQRCEVDGDCSVNRCVDGVCGRTGCGDAIVQDGEACDDGNTLNTDTCLNTCTPAACGDGFILMGAETCDDGNRDDGDACPSNCQVATCGDGFVRAGVEQCDDGNDLDHDGCTSACTLAACGDGVVGPGEACDDGNDLDHDGCTSDCTLATCGDGVVRAGVEQCDDGNDLDNDSCPSTCRFAGCGDGFVGPGEACDDGNLDNSDGCLTDCTLPRCGDGIVSADEQCDDGNGVDSDLCSNSCELATCSDGVRNGLETDIDCGGPECGPCPDGRACNGPEDCQAGFCSYGTVCGPAVSCLDHRLAGATTSGLYAISPDGAAPVSVYCDMVTDGGGWTIVASSRTTPLSDEASGYHAGLRTPSPGAGHRGVWSGLRRVTGGVSDIRFTCKHATGSPDMVVDLSYYATPWYDEITTGSDAESCFNEGDGAGWDGPMDRRNNLTGQRLHRSVTRTERQGCSGLYMEGEDVCGDTDDFSVDFNGRGKDCNESDGTDWGADDGELKCGQGALGGGTWHIWVREHTCTDGVQNRDETDIDCGGTLCAPCGPELACLEPSDCQSGLCIGGVCRPSHCGNGALDAGELDVDCGGAGCGACAAGQSCLEDAGCQSGVCDQGTCTSAPTSCLDALENDPTALDGTYLIDPDGSGPAGGFEVHCDMSTDGGGWTLALNAGIGDFERSALGDAQRTCFEARCLSRAFSTVPLERDLMLDADDSEMLGLAYGARSIIRGVDEPTRGLTLRQIFTDETRRYFLEREDNANLSNDFQNGFACGGANWSDYGTHLLCGQRVLTLNDPLSCTGVSAALGGEQSQSLRWNNCAGWPQSPDYGGVNAWPDYLRIWLR